MSLDSLLAPRTGSEPSGDNLEYDPEFIALEAAAQPREERQIGSTVVAAEEPDHVETARLALRILERAHDLRAAVHLAGARLRLEGLEGFAPPVAYVRTCLETWWDSCHPQVDPDDDDDPTMRINTVRGLAAGETVLRYLQLAPLTDSPTFGRISLRQIGMATGEINRPEDAEPGPDMAAITAAFRDTKVDVLKARLEAARAALADVQAINAVFDEKTPGQGPDLDPLIRMLRKAVAQIAGALGESAEPANPSPDAEATEEATVTDAARPAAAAPPPGTITSSADVRAALDRIIAYYATYEPSSPLPILLHRARRLVGADFITIINDIAPDGLEAVRNIGGVKDEE